MIQAPGVGEGEAKFEEKFGETMDEEVEEAGIEDLHMEDRPFVAPAEASEVPRASMLEGWRFKRPPTTTLLGLQTPTSEPSHHQKRCKSPRLQLEINSFVREYTILPGFLSSSHKIKE